MDARSSIQRRRQELCDEAFYLVLKSLAFKDKPETVSDGA